MVLDEPNEDEVVYQANDIQFLADTSMQAEINKAGGLKVEFIDHPWFGSGFKISLENPASDCSSSGCSC